MLIAILRQLSLGLDRLASGTGILRQAWHRRCLLTGRTVEVDQPNCRLIGLCQGIDSDGALVLETATGVERCLSGVVVSFA